MRCTELPGLRDLGHLSYDDFKFSKRVTGLLRGYDHKFLEPHHRHIPPEFDDELYLNFESMYSYLRKRYRAQLSKQDLYLILRTQGQVHVSHWSWNCPGNWQLWTCRTASRMWRPAKVTTNPSSTRWGRLRWSSRSSRLTTSSRWKIWRGGLYPRVPIYPHLAEAEVAEEFRVIYHYTSWNALQQIICTGIFPGATSCKGHVYMTRHAPWGNWRQGSWCQDEQTAVHCNWHRLRFALWSSPGGNLGRCTHLRGLDPQPLPHLRIRLREVAIPLGQPRLQRDQEVPSAEGHRECPRLGRERGSEGHSRVRRAWEVWMLGLGSIENAFCEWIWSVEGTWSLLRRPLIYKEVPTPYPVVDELLPKTRQRPLNFTKPSLCGAKTNCDGCWLRHRPWQRAGTPFWSLRSGGIWPIRGGEPHALAVCIYAGYARIDMPPVQENFSWGNVGLPCMRLVLGDYVQHASCMPGLPTRGARRETWFELTLDLLGDDDVAGTTQRCQADQICCCSPQKSCPLIHEAGHEKRGWHCSSVWERTPTTPLIVRSKTWRRGVCIGLPSSATSCSRTSSARGRRSELEKIRQYKARMCLVAYEEADADESSLTIMFSSGTRTAFTEPNQFAAAYALIPVADRFEVLSVANTTFQSLALSRQDVYADILSYVDDILRPSRRQRTRKAEADPCLLPSSKIQMSPGLRVLGMDHIRGPLMATVNRSGTISTTSGLDQEWEDWRRRNQGHQYRDRRWSGYRWDTREGNLSPGEFLIQLRRGSFSLCEVSHSGSCCLLWFNSGRWLASCTGGCAIPPSSKLKCAKSEFLPTQSKFTTFPLTLWMHIIWSRHLALIFILAMIPSCWAHSW